MLPAANVAKSASRRLVAGARRSASHSAHHGEQHAYEGFATPFWRNVVLLSLTGVAFYKYAPNPSESVYLTRWIKMYTAPREEGADMTAKYTVLAQEFAESGHLLKDAKQPYVRRLRNPMTLEQRSPFNHGVGATVDLSDVVVKSDLPAL